MPVLSRPALEASPLADLHALAAELGIDGFRRLRKADLVGAILERQGGEDEGAAEGPAAEDGTPVPRDLVLAEALRRERPAVAEPR